MTNTGDIQVLQVYVDKSLNTFPHSHLVYIFLLARLGGSCCLLFETTPMILQKRKSLLLLWNAQADDH